MKNRRVVHSVDKAIIEENTKSDKNKRAFAVTLDLILEEQEVHQRDLAKEIGISMSVISDYRRGVKMPNAATLLKLSSALGVDCHYLLTGIKSEDFGVAKNLGLSQAAISQLKQLAIANVLIDSAGDFIASDAFRTIVSLSHNYRETAYELSKRADDISSESSDLQQIANKANLYEYYATKALSKYFDEIRETALSKSKTLKKTDAGYIWELSFGNRELENKIKREARKDGKHKSDDD